MMQCVATVLIVLCGLLNFSHAKENQCPGDKASCPDVSTCCVLSNGSFGCCPIQNAVCCGDSVHCCPDGYTCDVVNGICKMGRKLVPLLMKFPEKLTMVPAPKTERADGTISPNKECQQCSYWSTCCKHPHGTYSCCPLMNAVCCSDHKHCCPEGHTCDVAAAGCRKRAEHINVIETIQAIKTSRAGECIKGFETKVSLKKTAPQVTKISAALQLLPRVICPDGTICFPKKKCCPNGHGFYKCCPRVSF